MSIAYRREQFPDIAGCKTLEGCVQNKRRHALELLVAKLNYIKPLRIG